MFLAQKIFSLISGMVSVRIDGDRVTKSICMTARASSARNIDTMSIIALVVITLRTLLLGCFATEHGAHEGTLHPVRMGGDEGTLFGTVVGAFAVRWAFARFSIVSH